MRLNEETEYRPKPMVEVGGRPILWHIMRSYRAYGVREFVLCLGYKGDVIRDYFVNFPYRGGSDVRVDLADGRIDVLTKEKIDWRVTLVETGLETMTGARIRRAVKYVTGTRFFATYGDGVSDINFTTLLDFHVSQERLATVTAVRAPSRFGELSLDGSLVTSFIEKPQTSTGWINGGFLVLETKAVHDLPEDEGLVLESALLKSLAIRRELAVYKHTGFWQCMDTNRELQLLNGMWDSGNAPWVVD
jgi:glucose-1-phosphate cytidylyltransferase